MIDFQQLFQQAGHVLPDASAVRVWAAGLGAWAPVLLVMLQAASVVVAPVPAGPFTFAEVALLGAWPSWVTGVVGTVVGSVAAFMLGRRCGWPLVHRLGGTRVTGALGGSDGMWLLPVLALPIPLGGDVACFAAGLCDMRLRRFALLATVGRVPGTTLGVLMSSGLTTGSPWWLVIGALGSAALFAVARHRRAPRRRVSANDNWTAPTGRSESV
ncbi:putative membrane protein YdjX (TVP38/TMEM64 family) [Saccharopolyspora lacisalsi]|uniref:TVP38/TMEM64 family membrane protein n=1 Tax=Halosaccharopolyspora lacisalsi TaxID=1000566 RepID=A0A839E1V3_9PSEU|nr:VTT domain-containing protein [Halosaccharopolyspora lacisalsi]MBA8827243.1 putative membrane protein YdjX (TVP38/TMEM64 family) [Halosaccharopolyspora lacisalsi]